MNTSNNAFQMIADFEGDLAQLLQNDKHDNPIPLLVTRNFVLFPGVIAPILIGREPSLNLIHKLDEGEDKTFALFSQKNDKVDDPNIEDVYHTGVYAKLVKVLEIPGTNNLTAIVQGLGRCKLVDMDKKVAPYYMGYVDPLENDTLDMKDREVKTAVDEMRKKALELIARDENLPNEAQFGVNNIGNAQVLVNYLCCNFPFKTSAKYKLLNTAKVKTRLFNMM